MDLAGFLKEGVKLYRTHTKNTYDERETWAPRIVNLEQGGNDKRS